MSVPDVVIHSGGGAKGRSEAKFLQAPRLAVVVASTATPSALAEWLDPLAALASSRGASVVVARNAPLPDLAPWQARFPEVHFVVARGDRRALGREGARATSAEALLLTHDADPDACRRLVRLSDSLDPRRSSGRMAAPSTPGEQGRSS